MASLTKGSIIGVVQDEKGAGIGGAMVSAVGALQSAPGQSGSGSAFAITDKAGRFEMRTLAPGPYLVRAHLSGFVTSRGQMIAVRPSERVSSSIALRRAAVVETNPRPIPVLEAGLGAGFGTSAPSAVVDEPEPAAIAERAEGNLVGPVPVVPGGLSLKGDPSGIQGSNGENEPGTTNDDHGEVAWRIRHARRSVLKDTSLPVDTVDFSDAPASAGAGFGQHGVFGRVAQASAHAASNLFAGNPFSGQVNLLAAGSFDTPQQLFSGDGFARSIAYLALRVPAGEHADWTVRGALTQGDISSWIVAAAYTTRTPARHHYNVGMSYSTQQYGAGSPVALPDGGVGTRSAGAVYAFDTFTIAPAVSVTFGARVDRYDYLSKPDLVSPRVTLNLSPSAHFRINAVVSRSASAPGAEEFAPPVDAPIWLPPQRTFSSLAPGGALEAERTNHVELGIERDILGASVSLGTFHQHVAEQIATIFGVDLPGAPAARLGHYLVARAGGVDTLGWTVGLRTPASKRVRGSVEYSESRANWIGGDDLAYMILLAPSAARIGAEHIHDVATTVETRVPETSTRVLLLYRVGNGFASAGERSSFDSRFDVQVRQSLPFMDFTSARWEMLLAVRNVFREAALDSSVFDELLVVRPPTRIVGGLTLRF